MLDGGMVFLITPPSGFVFRSFFLHTSPQGRWAPVAPRCNQKQMQWLIMQANVRRLARS